MINLATDQLKQIATSLDAKIELIKQRYSLSIFTVQYIIIKLVLKNVYYSNRMEYLRGMHRISFEEMQSMSYLGKQAATTHQPCVMQSLIRKSSLQLEIIQQQQHPLVPAMMNTNNYNVENQVIRDENMLFDHHQYPPQPMCYFVSVVTPTNYFHHHQYPMLQTHDAAAAAAAHRGQYYEMTNDLPNNYATMK